MASKENARPATKADVALLKTGIGRLDEKVARLDAKVGGVEERLDAKVDGVEERLDAKIDGVEKRLDAKIDGVEKRLDAKIDGVEKRLDAKIDGVIVEVVKLQVSVREMKAAMSTKDDISRVLAAIDGFARTNEIHARETLTLPAAIDALGEKLRGHEARLAEHDLRLKAVETLR